MSDFHKIKQAITQQWSDMVKHDLYRVAVEKDQLWATYLAAFPEGTNPIFRERTEHDCSCCRQFIRAIGDAVAIVEGKLVSLWDVTVDDPTYQAVASAMAALVKSMPIDNVFLHGEKRIGVDKNFEEDEHQIRAWEHFHVTIPDRANHGKNYYRLPASIAAELGEKRSSYDVLRRGLYELTMDALDTVLEIVGQGSLYRGTEFKGVVDAFRKLKAQFLRVPDAARDIFIWEQVEKVSPALARVRNSAIGTLLIDLSEGLDLEDAVRKFETSIMAPANYKRPTALVSQRMVDDARVAVEKLGLTTALERRYARLSDVSVNDIIFADRSVKPTMKDGAFDGIATTSARVPKDFGKVETVPIEKFITEIVPHATAIEVLLENKHEGNLVSLVAPVHKEAKPLFKWGNGFSWAYNGDLADSMRERVKRAGGSVTGDLCCRLAWYNYDDLDLHMREPHPFFHIYYGARISPRGGQLDVDMNAGIGRTREPVENIYYGQRHHMIEGIYTLEVNQYHRRESRDVGFEVELDYLGEITSFAYPRAVTGTVQVAKFEYTHAGGLKILESLPATSVTRTLWGIKTQEFQRVTVLMNSPNHWEGAGGVGNKHYFFMLDGCINEGQARGFFNEFLLSDLDKHRKVIEIVGSKMTTQSSANQLCGIGFSDSTRAELLVRVKGSFNRMVKVTI